MLDTMIWQWLPARADRTRMTDASTIAAELGRSTPEINAALVAMERRGQAVRDRPTGRRANHWHRGKPC